MFIFKMGVLLLEQGKSVQAMARFDQALQLDPEHEVRYLNKKKYILEHTRNKIQT